MCWRNFVAHRRIFAAVIFRRLLCVKDNFSECKRLLPFFARLKKECGPPLWSEPERFQIGDMFPDSGRVFGSSIWNRPDFIRVSRTRRQGEPTFLRRPRRRVFLKSEINPKRIYDLWALIPARATGRVAMWMEFSIARKFDFIKFSYSFQAKIYQNIHIFKF